METDDLESERALWIAFRSIYRSKGIDLERLINDCAAEFIRQLPTPGPRDSFGVLCSAGCHQWILGALVALTRHRADIESVWAGMAGPATDRFKAAEELRAAATALERVFGDLVSIDGASDFAKIGRIGPGALAAELQLYANMMTIGGRLLAGVDARSIDETCALALTDYVRVSTGRPHHEQVSSLLDWARGDVGYSAEAQRQWHYRKRNWLSERASGLSRLTDFLTAMGSVLPRM